MRPFAVPVAHLVVVPGPQSEAVLAPSGALVVGLALAPGHHVILNKAAPAPAISARRLELTCPDPDAWAVESIT